MRGRSLPVPAPIKTMRYYDAMTEPAEVVVDTGSSTPPSDSSYSPPALYHPYAASPPSDSSSSPPAFYHPYAASQPSDSSYSPPAFYHPYAASPPSDSSSSPPAFYHPSAAARPSPPRVEVRPVWRHNFAQEAALIESLLPRFRYAAVDTEYPGTVHRPAGPAYLLTAGKRYALLKANVDELDLIQPGLTLFNDDSDPAASITWEFNLREFDPLRHRHAPESVAMLRARGVDFHRTRRHGVHAAALGARLRKWLRAGLGRAVVVTFSGGYDLAYLVKTMYGL
jgi:CCR4-NOT transcription complex subunit 7/8